MMLLEQGGESISLYKQCCWSEEEGKLYISNRFLVCCSRRGAQGRLDKNYPPWWVSADGMHKGIEEANFPGGRARLRRSFSIIIGSMNGRGEWYSCASYTRYPCTCTLQHVTIEIARRRTPLPRHLNLIPGCVWSLAAARLSVWVSKAYSRTYTASPKGGSTRLVSYPTGTRKGEIGADRQACWNVAFTSIRCFFSLFLFFMTERSWELYYTW